MKFKLLTSLLFGTLLLAACTHSGSQDDMDEAAMVEDTEEIAMEDDGKGDTRSGSDETASVELASIEGFDQEAYEAALAEKKTVFLDFYAPWCSTCRANAAAIESAVDETEGDVVAFRVDYDSGVLQSDFGIRSQSTYILIPEGDTENYRQLGPGSVSEEDVRAFLES